MKKIVISTGGTGGHVLPAMDLGVELQKYPEVEVEFIGVGLQSNPYFDRESQVYTNLIGGNFSQGIFSGLKKIKEGFLKARRKFVKDKVDRVIGFGSFHSLPALLAAWSLRIPFDLVELNTYPGRVNRLLTRFAKKNYIHFDPSRKWLKGEITMVNFGLKKIEKPPEKSEALACFGLSPEKKVVLVFGGSQGAKGIDKAWLANCHKFKDDIQVIHGTSDVMQALAVYKKNGIPAFVSPFIGWMDLAYKAADIVISRSGAGALRDMILHERPALLIPLNHAKDDHQVKNARYMQNEIGGGIMLRENDALTQNMEAHLKQFISDDDNKFSYMRTCLLRHKASSLREDLASTIRSFL